MQMVFESIGHIDAKQGFAIRLEPEFGAGLSGLGGFGHVVVLWYSHQADWNSDLMRASKPYRNGPSELGVFATRSPLRPNRICRHPVPEQLAAYGPFDGYRAQNEEPVWLIELEPGGKLAESPGTNPGFDAVRMLFEGAFEDGPGAMEATKVAALSWLLAEAFRLASMIASASRT